MTAVQERGHSQRSAGSTRSVAGDPHSMALVGVILPARPLRHLQAPSGVQNFQHGRRPPTPRLQRYQAESNRSRRRRSRRQPSHPPASRRRLGALTRHGYQACSETRASDSPVGVCRSRSLNCPAYYEGGAAGPYEERQDLARHSSCLLRSAPPCCRASRRPSVTLASSGAGSRDDRNAARAEVDGFPT